MSATIAIVAGLVCTSASAAAAYAQSAPPALSAPVNDFAGVLDTKAAAAIDRLIRQLQTASGDVLVVATIRTFRPEADLRTYANRMFENRGRGIGAKGRDNGLLILLAIEDREVWIEVGYDLEAIVTDGFAGETSRNTMVPFFRSGDYGAGLLAGATRLAQRIASARGVALDGVAVPQPSPADDEGGFPIVLAIFVAIMIINALRGLGRGLAGGRVTRRRRWISMVGPFGAGYHRGGWGGRSGGFGGGFSGFGGGRSGGGGGGARW
jgi:uncharacterized protein